MRQSSRRSWRGRSHRGGKSLAGDRIVLVHYGGNQEVIDNAQVVIRYFNDHGKLSALALADPEVDGEESFHIYIAGQRITEKFPATTDPMMLGSALNGAILRAAEVTASLAEGPSGGG